MPAVLLMSRCHGTQADSGHQGFLGYVAYLLDWEGPPFGANFRIDAIANEPPVTVSFQSAGGRLYSLFACTNLTGGAWTNVLGQTDVPGTGGLQSLTDTNTRPRAFYRLGVKLP